MARRNGKGRGRQTGQRSKLLEECTNSLIPLGFKIFTGKEFNSVESLFVPEKYVITHYKHTSLYGTDGWKEGLIVAPENGRGFSDQDGKTRFIVECKFQNVGGSTDEKLPYVYHSCLESMIPNWIVVCGGPVWNTARGRGGVAWLESKIEEAKSLGRHLVVLSDWKHATRKFCELITEYWGA